MLDAFAEVLADGRPGRDHRHLGGARPGHHDHLGGGPRRGGQPPDAGAGAIAIGDPEAAAAWLAEHVEPGDVVLVMGGGRSYVAAERLVERLRDRSAR